MHPFDDIDLNRRYLSEAQHELAQIRAGGAPPPGRSRDEHIEILEENLAIYQRAVERRG